CAEAWSPFILTSPILERAGLVALVPITSRAPNRYSGDWPTARRRGRGGGTYPRNSPLPLISAYVISRTLPSARVLLPSDTWNATPRKAFRRSSRAPLP